MSSGESGDQSHKFEVVIPDGSPDQLAALEGLAGAFNWFVRPLNERKIVQEGPAERSEVIQTSDLQAVSHELWGKTDYGNTAASLLELEKQQAEFTVYINSGQGMSRGYLGADNFKGIDRGRSRIVLPTVSLPRQLGDRREHPLGRATTDVDEVGSRLEAFLAFQHPLPFSLEHDPLHGKGSTEFRRPVLDVKPRAVTRASLAQYVTAKGFDAHEMHGTIGKALDVLGVAAEVLSEPRTEEVEKSGDPEDSLISVTDLLQAAQEYGIPYVTKGKIKQKLGYILLDQLASGKPIKSGGPELIVEGSFNALDIEAIDPIRAVKTSLTVVADSYGRPTKSADFLRETARQR